MSVLFTVDEVATLAHLVGRNAEALLLSGSYDDDVTETIFKALSVVDVRVAGADSITCIPEGAMGIVVPEGVK